MRRWRHGGTVALGTIVVALLGGCALDVGSAGGRAEPSVYGPIDDVLMAGTDWVTAQDAIHRKKIEFFDACRAAHGAVWSTPAEPLSRDDIVLEGYRHASGTELADQFRREREGYGETSTLVGIRPIDTGPSEAALRARAVRSPATQEADDKATMACHEEAQNGGYPTELLAKLADVRLDLRERLMADRRLKKAEAAWSRCMEAAGHDYPTVDKPQERFDRLANPLYLEIVRNGLTEVRESDVTDEARRLHAEELRTAADDWACREKTYTSVYRAVRDDLESEFLERNAEFAEQLGEEMKRLIAAG